LTDSPRAALLNRCLAFVQEGGFGHLSLREIAAGAGTSHRMLIYHFGSREGLLAEIVGRIEAEQRLALADLAQQEGTLADISRVFWQRLTDPSLAPAERLFFETYVQALHGRSWTDGFRQSVIDAWEGPLISLLAGHGVEPVHARKLARLALATTRGLLLDLLMTGERELVDEAAELFSALLTHP